MTLTLKQAAVLRILTGLAQSGRPCPTNREIGNLIGSELRATSEIIHRLAKLGFIEVNRCGNDRTVRIVDMGITTAAQELSQHLERRRAREKVIRAAKPDDLSTADAATRRSCQILLARQLQTGAHWITDPTRFARAMHEAGIAA